MQSTLIVVALAMLSSMALASENLYEKEGYRFDMRERLGHFAKAPFTDLYKQYAVAFIAPNFDDRDADDYRNYRPSADVCRSFFAGFVGHDYKVDELDQVIVLDACLAYVVEGVYKNDPDASDENKAQFAAMAKDDRIASLYKTNLDEYQPAERTCVAHLLLNSVLAKKQYPEIECNNDMLQLYIQFAECQEETPLSSYKASDPYVRVVYDLVKERVKKCVDHEMSHMNNAVRAKFGSEWFKRAALKMSTSKSKKQQLQRMWPTPMVTLLQAIQNTDGEINLRHVHHLLASVQHKDDLMKKRLVDNVAAFADRKIKPSKGPKKSSSAAFTDPRGDARYKALVDQVCNPFRSSDSEKDYDFATPIIRLVELLNHEKLFDVSKRELLHHMVTYSYESAPLYMCVSACNLLTFTEGTTTTTGPGKSHYEVHFLPDTSRMVSWPKADFV